MGVTGLLPTLTSVTTKSSLARYEGLVCAVDAMASLNTFPPSV
jgi:hypothetical protein